MHVSWQQKAQWLIPVLGAGITQSVVCWARCPAWCSVPGSNLLWASGRGDFSVRVNMVSDSIPPKTLLDQSINWGLVYAHKHSIAGTQKIWHSRPRQVNACNKNTPSMHHPWRQNVTTSMVTYTKISPKIVSPRDIAGYTEEEDNHSQVIPLTSTLVF